MTFQYNHVLSKEPTDALWVSKEFPSERFSSEAVFTKSKIVATFRVSTRRCGLGNRFLPEASFGLRVLSLPACVCMCVCVCVSVNHELVRAIIHQPFKLGSPNLVQRSKTPWLRSLLFFWAMDLDLQGQI